MRNRKLEMKTKSSFAKERIGMKKNLKSHAVAIRKKMAKRNSLNVLGFQRKRFFADGMNFARFCRQRRNRFRRTEICSTQIVDGKTVRKINLVQRRPQSSPFFTAELSTFSEFRSREHGQHKRPKKNSANR